MEKAAPGPVFTGTNVVEEMDELGKRHEELERRLADLDRHLSLTSAEQVERSRLKKEKLQVKDRLQRLGMKAVRPAAVGS